MASKGSRLFENIGKELGISNALDVYKEMRENYKRFLHVFLIERRVMHRSYPLDLVRRKPYLFDQVVDFSISDEIDFEIATSYAKSLVVSENRNVFTNVIQALINFAILNSNVGIVKLEGLHNEDLVNDCKAISFKDFFANLLAKKNTSFLNKITSNCDTITRNIFHWTNNTSSEEDDFGIPREILLYAVKEVKVFKETIS